MEKGAILEKSILAFCIIHDKSLAGGAGAKDIEDGLMLHGEIGQPFCIPELQFGDLVSFRQKLIEKIRREILLGLLAE
uniref:Uncharacterized protein n=1 Tax=Candidatus Kentrum sp. LFY TaxID=2126342 RepID=A0A450WW24_9GAMM|nr:MAG: hypothetical protein BECKLFY1418C_GA0070996_10883 [Candidatus Kentron sp. LFY]